MFHQPGLYSETPLEPVKAQRRLAIKAVRRGFT